MPDQGLNIVAIRLREARERKGLSQRALGIAAGIDEFSASPRVNQYERGKHVPDLLTLSKLASVLRVPLAYFYADDEKLAELLVMLNALPHSEWVHVQRYVMRKIAANNHKQS